MDSEAPEAPPMGVAAPEVAGEGRVLTSTWIRRGASAAAGADTAVLLGGGTTEAEEGSVFGSGSEGWSAVPLAALRLRGGTAALTVLLISALVTTEGKALLLLAAEVLS